jgi:hypothetical protein
MVYQSSYSDIEQDEMTNSLNALHKLKPLPILTIL